ncbi:hypothetical protein [Prevotella sp.]|uniref:hypothetical protein n=1 Tax=Prevotella sp. TaxID=59823 RepID=UPI001CB22ADD|nr:hypothetical protein [Prevotella sp.]MBF1629247.1 hypothetical protein [Prevotella sp.]
MPFSCVFIPSGWVASYPTAGYRRTHSLGNPLPIRWVRSHFFAGYDWTSSLGTMNIATIAQHTIPKTLNSECSLHFLSFTSLRSVTVGSERIRAGL